MTHFNTELVVFSTLNLPLNFFSGTCITVDLAMMQVLVFWFFFFFKLAKNLNEMILIYDS